MRARLAGALLTALTLTGLLLLLGASEGGAWEPWNAGPGCTVDFVCDPAYGLPPVGDGIEAGLEIAAAIEASAAATGLVCDRAARPGVMPARMVLSKEGAVVEAAWSLPAPAGWWVERLCYSST